MASWVRSITGARSRTKPHERPARHPKPRAPERTHRSTGPARRPRTQAGENSQTQRLTWYDLDQFNSDNSADQGPSPAQQQFPSPRRSLYDHQSNTSGASNVDFSPASESPSRTRPMPFQESHRFNPEDPFPASKPQKFTPPPSSHELDRLNYHRALSDFGQDLQKAANAVFSENRTSRYTRVDVILLSWEDEDPRLPVSLEIRELADTFTQSYGFNVVEWLIPAEDCHNSLQARILQFLGENNPKHLKIVYYGGHGKLTNHGTPAWTSRRNSARERCPTVKWSGIQNTLEESRSDVLILLDCCASGICTTDEGNGSTELIAACAYNAIANGVGPFSFTHALNAKLRSMAQMPYLNVGYLYNSVFTEVQSWRIEDSRFKKAPIHLVLAQNHEWPCSIRLPNFSRAHSSGSVPQNLRDVAIATSIGPSSSGESRAATGNSIFSQNVSLPSSMSSTSRIQEYPRLLFSIRIQEDVNPNELSSELFADWLRQIPLSTNQVRVEAGFKSDSTLLMVSLPIAFHGYLRKDPAIQLLGTIRSKNCMQVTAQEVTEAEVTEVAEASLTNQVPRSKNLAFPRTSGGYASRGRDSQRLSGLTIVTRREEGSELSFSKIDLVDSAKSTEGTSMTEHEGKPTQFSETDQPTNDHHKQGTERKSMTKSKAPDYNFPPDIKAKLAPHLYQRPQTPPAPDSKESKWTPPEKQQFQFSKEKSYETKHQCKEDDIVERTIQKLLESRISRTDAPPGLWPSAG